MRHMPHTLYHSAQYNWLSALLDVLVRLTDQSRVTCMLGLSPPVSPSLGNRGLGTGSHHACAANRAEAESWRKHVGHLIQTLVLQHSSLRQ